MMKNRTTFVILIIIVISAGIFAIAKWNRSKIGKPQTTGYGIQATNNDMKTVKKSTGQRKILYYRNPMNPEITSPVPTKDSMGMDYIPVYEDEVAKPRAKGVVGSVYLKGEQTRLAEVKTEPVKKLHLFKEIRTVGSVAYDPELAIAQEEFISALEARDKMQKGGISGVKERAQKLVESSTRKLRLLGLSNEQIKDLEEKREVQTSLILPEEKMWIYGDIYEYELIWVKVGERVKVITSSLPGEEFNGVISSINPVLDPRTRSVRFRAQVDNPNVRLQPEMYVDVIIESMYVSPEGHHPVLAVPREAVLDTGLRKIVWVNLGNGEYQGREIRVGPEATAKIGGKKKRYLPILSGLKEGELVVTRGNFLIDSQSQLTGTAAGAYGGALEAEEEAALPSKHVH